MKTDCTLFAALLVALAVPAAAQSPCSLHWQPGHGSPGTTNYQVITTTLLWDPDGNGPRGDVIVCGGQFDMPSVGASHVAMFDPAIGNWEAFPGSPDRFVNSLTVLADGRLAIGGSFSTIGGAPLAGVAIFDGTSWSSPGGGIPMGALHVEVKVVRGLQNGDLVVGGNFVIPATPPIVDLARWDGTRWHGFGAFDGTAQCIAERPNGNLVVGGSFNAIGQPGYANIAEWNGTAWMHYGSGAGNNYSRVDTCTLLGNGDVVIAGFFNLVGGVPASNIARWDGSSWHAMGSNYQGQPRALLPQSNGDLLATPLTTIGGNGVFGVARWNGATWSAEAPLIGDTTSMTPLANGELLVSGTLSTGARAFASLAIWNGTAWRPLTTGTNGTVQRLLAQPNGDVVATGSFTLIDDQGIRRMARWNGTSWSPLPAPAGPGNYTALAPTAIDRNGDLWTVHSANGTPTSLFRWTGSGWIESFPAYGTHLTFDANNQPLVVQYDTRVARVTATGTQQLGGQFDGPVLGLCALDNGDVVAYGQFLNHGTTPTPRIARWDGTTWHSMGNGFDGPVRVVTQLPGGDVVAGGDFYADGSFVQALYLVARWNGTSWQQLGAGLGGPPDSRVLALHVAPNGDLIVGGKFATAGGTPMANLARWNGSQWLDLGGVSGPVLTIAQRPDGELWIGGDFARVGNENSAHLARLRTDCAATATTYGVPCLGSLGPVSLAADNLPWVGGVFRSTCYGANPGSLGFALLGLTATQQPLATLHPLGGAGCSLFVQPLATTLLAVNQGALQLRLSLPNVPALAGIVLRQQAVVVELDATQAITTIAASNALALTIGSF